MEGEIQHRHWKQGFKLGIMNTDIIHHNWSPREPSKPLLAPSALSERRTTDQQTRYFLNRQTVYELKPQDFSDSSHLVKLELLTRRDHKKINIYKQLLYPLRSTGLAFNTWRYFFRSSLCRFICTWSILNLLFTLTFFRVFFFFLK